MAHIQDLFDTIFQSLLKSGGEKNNNKVISNIQDAGDAYYETYTDIKKGKDTK